VARPASLGDEAVQVAVITAAPVHGAGEAHSGERARSHDVVTKEHDAQQLAEHDGRSSADGSASHDGGGEHTATTTTKDDGEHTASPEQSGKRSDSQPTDPQRVETQPTETQPTETQPTETQPTETQPTETQPAEPQDQPEHSGTTSSPSVTTTTVDGATPLPALSVDSVPGG
jgi:hypothetical protein